MTPATVAVIGAGFSGLLTALHLLARADGLRVVLIERGDAFGGGVAFGACTPEHLLNVRAGNMSAFPDRPDHFIAWMRARGRPELDGAAFVTRRAYGDYLRQLLRDAATTGRVAGRLGLVGDQAVSLRKAGQAWQLELGMGRTLDADAVVLALGVLPPRTPRLSGAIDGLASARYVADPWAEGALAGVAPDHAVMLLGSGLTMVDVLVSLTAAGHHGPLFSLSRHGLTPRRHAGAPAAPDEPPRASARLSQSLRLFRDAVQDGRDWRRTFDALRPLTQGLWSRLDEPERRRFLRHLRAYWDVHRHRLPPVVADQLDSLTTSGRLRVRAGRLLALAREGDRLGARWRPRGRREPVEEQVDWLINCTGPEGDVSRAEDPLLKAVIRQGLARPDRLGLGLDVDGYCQVRDGAGHSDFRLSAVGPLTRGGFWETIAVPDIRLQAAEVAARVSDGLSRQRRTGDEQRPLSGST